MGATPLVLNDEFVAGVQAHPPQSNYLQFAYSLVCTGMPLSV